MFNHIKGDVMILMNVRGFSLSAMIYTHIQCVLLKYFVYIKEPQFGINALSFDSAKL